jgi:hypothetical protein
MNETKTSPKTAIFWSIVIVIFEVIGFYYGGVDSLQASCATLFAIALAYMCWRELKKEE